MALDAAGIPLSSDESMSAHTTIVTLPNELIYQVFKYLNPQDIKSLRLCGRTLIQITTGHLFKRVVVSPLKRHIEALERISKSEYLSQFPRELVWYELDLSSLALGDGSLEPGRWEQWHALTLYMGYHSDGHRKCLNKVYKEILSHINDAFKWTAEQVKDGGNQLTGLSIYRWLEPRLIDYLADFAEVMKNLPHVYIFESRPCPFDVIVMRNRRQCCADFIQSHLSKCPNIGLLLMLRYIAASDRGIKVLRWADGVISTNTMLRHVQFPVLKAFRFFTSIDLCLGGVHLFGEEEHLENADFLAAALFAAKNLERLGLCFEERRGASLIPLRFLKNYADANKMVNNLSDRSTDFLSNSRPYWAKLSTLKLKGFTFPQAAIHNFLSRHANTLRHLNLEHCTLRHDKGQSLKLVNPWRQLFEALAAQRIYHLQSLRIYDEIGFYADLGETDPPDAKYLYTDPLGASLLLAFINNTGLNPFTSAKLPKEYSPNEADAETFFRFPDPTENLPQECYWHLRRVQNHIVWWSSSTPEQHGDVPPGTPTPYPTEKWLFESRNGDIAYGDEPLDFFSTFGSELGNDDYEEEEEENEDEDEDENEEEWEDVEDEDENEEDIDPQTRQVYGEASEGGELVFEDRVTETPFGETFNKFRKSSKSEWGYPASITLPSSALVRMYDGSTMAWIEFQNQCKEQDRGDGAEDER